jgi:hypothetical protein
MKDYAAAPIHCAKRLPCQIAGRSNILVSPLHDRSGHECGALLQKQQAEQKSEAEPSREHYCDVGRSRLRGIANASIALGEESRTVTWRGERPARSHAFPTQDIRYWIKILMSHNPPSHWCHSELTYLELR